MAAGADDIGLVLDIGTVEAKRDWTYQGLVSSLPLYLLSKPEFEKETSGEIAIFPLWKKK
jgi:hypothetical protein